MRTEGLSKEDLIVVEAAKAILAKNKSSEGNKEGKKPYKNTRKFDLLEIAKESLKVSDELSKVNCAVSILKGCNEPREKKGNYTNLERMEYHLQSLNKEGVKAFEFDETVDNYIKHVVECPVEDFLRMALTIIELVKGDREEASKGKEAVLLAGEVCKDLMQIQNRLKFVKRLAEGDKSVQEDYIFNTDDRAKIQAFLEGEKNGTRIDKIRFIDNINKAKKA